VITQAQYYTFLWYKHIALNDHIVGIHLVSMAREHMWEKKSSKDIKVIGMEDKQQVTTCVTSNVDRHLLSMRIVFIGKTNQCLPKTSLARVCLDHVFHFSMIENHWSNLKTCQ